ncbi:MAG: hypothetical protein HYZ81_13580 [Nitrospinae bacterium]|nr:hypothetical protein [Nitrospinota bacterium]
MDTTSDRVVTCQHCGQASGCPHCGHRGTAPQAIGGAMAAESSIRFGLLKRMLEELATVAWKSAEALQQPAFHLDPGQLLDVHAEPDLERVLEAFLNHARQVAPGFSVPYFVPRVQMVPLTAAGGLFSEAPDGWVTITVADQFLTNPPAVRAILAHEACHYLLGSAEIKEADRHQNERLTDLCMFVCGFGPVYLAGYKTGPGQSEYRRGHRLGYLTDEEYQFADQYVLELRRTNALGLSSEVEPLRQRLAHLLRDDRVRDRLLAQARRKHPAKDEAWIYALVIDQLLRDRRG